MSEPIFEPNEEPLDENRVVESESPVRPDEDIVPVPEDEDTGLYGGGQFGLPRTPEELATDVEPVTPHDPQEPSGGNTPV